MKKIIITLLALILAVTMFAQDDSVEKWENGGAAGLQFSQAALKNWMAGGQNALALNTSFNYFFNYKFEKMTWKNNLDVAYGIQVIGGESEKTDDKIDFDSNFGYEAKNKWFYSALYSFKTQMFPGYADTVKISTFMAPAYMTLSAGMKYDSDMFSFMVSPLTGKMTVILDPTLSAAGSFGVNAGKKTRMELGGFTKIAFKAHIIKNVKFSTKCELFANYFAAPFTVDVNWDLMLAMKINKFLTTNISTQLIYDRDVNTAVQFKEVFTFGLSYSF